MTLQFHIGFNDNDGTNSTFNPEVVTARRCITRWCHSSKLTQVQLEVGTVAGFSAQALQYNAIEYGTGTVSTSTTGVDAVNQVITIDSAATTGGVTLAAAVGAATNGETFEITIGQTGQAGIFRNSWCFVQRW